MATVIRNRMVLHCLQQYGVTPEEVRRAESTDPGDASIKAREQYATLLTYLSDVMPMPPLELQDRK